jgi:dTDP-4-amino-4,6-dideoxygalactose transaminase
VDIGSSFLPGEIIAAFLYAQLEEVESITNRRLAMWKNYHQWLADAEGRALLRRPIVPAHCVHNGHMYYILLPDLKKRTEVIETLKRDGVYSVFHYVPLHSAPAGMRFGRCSGNMNVTDDISERLLRLPLWVGMEETQAQVIQTVLSAL